VEQALVLLVLLELERLEHKLELDLPQAQQPQHLVQLLFLQQTY
jgi:hypothetical protein